MCGVLGKLLKKPHALADRPEHRRRVRSIASLQLAYGVWLIAPWFVWSNYMP